MLRGEKFGGMYDGGAAIPNIGGGEAVVNEPVAGAEEPGAGEANEFAIPEEYKEKGWAKDLNSYEAVYKKLDGAESLLGKRPAEGIQRPGENATPEEMASFYGALGRPETADKYEFNREGQPEGMAAFNSPEMDNAAKDIFHKYGLTPEQATGIQTDYEALLGETYSQQVAAEQQLDNDFEAMTTKAFGNEKETILANAKALLTENTPEEFSDYVQNLPIEALTVMAGVLDKIKSKYISEDAFDTIKGGSSGAGTVEELRAQARELMLTPEFTDAFSPKNEERKAEVSAIYAKIAQMG